MSKVLIFNFDGTDNEPEDAMQDVSSGGKTEDNSITNILKFHLLIGGNLNDPGKPIDDKGNRSFYYNGVGTYGNWFERKLNAGLATGDDVATIINRAMQDFDTYYQEDIDKVLVTGFSRGGALARKFASLINGKVKGKCIIEGIYDTVASIGLPNLSSKDRPKSDVLFENGCTLPENVEKAIHLVSLDDKRKAFQPTLMNEDERILEVWFAGAHSDVGGGYFYDGLSDTSLRFFLDWFEDLNLGIKLHSSKTIKEDNLIQNSKVIIGRDDVQIAPDSFGINHQQDRMPVIEFLTLTDRRCCVIQNDRINLSEKPIVHWSVAERISGDRNYRPFSLKNVPHIILYPDGTTKEFSGISEHQLMSKRNWHTFTGVDSIETVVFAYKKYNHTRILLEEGKKYKIKRSSDECWNDGGIKNLGGEGWDRGDVQLGLQEFVIAGMEPFRRVPGADWFTLCGTVGDNDDSAFVIGNSCEFKAEKSGELCLFANDLDGYYGNNSGKLKITVTKV